MKRHITALLLIILICGCASHDLRFTSKPTGATVELQKNGRSKKWVEKGTTTCTIKMTAAYDPDLAQLTLPSGEKKQIELYPVKHGGKRALGTGGVGFGSVALMIGSFGTGSTPWLLGGAGLCSFGIYSLDRSYSYTNANFYVVFEKEK